MKYIISVWSTEKEETGMCSIRRTNDLVNDEKHRKIPFARNRKKTAIILPLNDFVHSHEHLHCPDPIENQLRAWNQNGIVH